MNKMETQGGDIFWLVRALVFIGAIMIVVGVLHVNWTLSAIRKDRLQNVQDSRALTQDLLSIRQLSENSRQQIRAIFDRDLIPDAQESGVVRLQRFIDLKNSQSTTATRHSLNALQEQVKKLNELWNQALDWRKRYDPVAEDVRNRKTLADVRTRVSKLRESFQIMEGKLHLEEALNLKKLREFKNRTTGMNNQAILSAIEFRGKHHQIEATHIQGDVMELALMIESLYAATSLDDLPDLLENQLVPIFTRLERALNTIGGDVLNLRFLKELEVCVVGSPPAPGGTVGRSLFELQRQRLDLAHERESLEHKTADIYQAINQATDDLRGIQETESQVLVHRIEQNVVHTRLQVSLVGGATFIIFIWVAASAYHRIKRQVRELDRAKTDAENNQSMMQTLYAMQEAAAKELAEAHHDIKLREQRFRQLSQSSPVGILELDAHGNCLYVNPQWTRITRLSQQQSAGNAWEGVIHPDDRAAFSRWNQVIDDHASFTMEVRFMAGEELRWAQFNILAIQGETNLTTGYVATLDDVTGRKKADDERQLMEVQLRHAQKLESIGQLASGIAHEINTPMQFISDNTHFLNESFEIWIRSYQTQKELLLAAGKEINRPELTTEITAATQVKRIEFLSREVPKAIHHTLEGIERVTKIVHAMKDFSHPGKQEKSAVDLNKAIDNTITVARNEWKYVSDVVTEFDSSLPLVVCYRDEFNQVILNLIVNSAHAIADVVGKTGEKGTITVTTCHDGDTAEIRVKDTGGGIPEKVRSRIFDPFFTTKAVGKGTGQGLAIAHAVITKKHHGSILFESEEGVGTTFIIRLPIAGREAEVVETKTDDTLFLP